MEVRKLTGDDLIKIRTKEIKVQYIDESITNDDYKDIFIVLTSNKKAFLYRRKK